MQKPEKSSGPPNSKPTPTPHRPRISAGRPAGSSWSSRPAEAGSFTASFPTPWRPTPCRKGSEPSRGRVRMSQNGQLSRHGLLFVLTALSALALADTALGQRNVVVVRPKEIHDVLVNPGMGITTFQRFNGQEPNP